MSTIMVPYACPTRVAEAVDVLISNVGARLIAGGTDLLVQLERSTPPPTLFVSLHKIDALRKIEADDSSLRLGACVSLATIAEDSTIAEAAPLLATTAQSMASPPVRSRGTLGGNLCNASPAADLAPPLLVHDAEVLLQGPNGRRRLPLATFLVGPGETALAEDEILVEVLVPRLSKATEFGHAKHQVGVCGNLSIISLAVGLVIDDDKGTCSDARIGLGAVAPTAVRYPDVEKCFIGARIDELLLIKAAEIAGRRCTPIDDIRSSCDHRCHLVEVLLPRLIMDIIGRQSRRSSPPVEND